VALTDEEVEAIAHLARLELSPEEIAHYRGDLERILALVQQFAEVETDEIEPMAHPLDLEQRLRVDAVTESDQHELFQSIAPNVSDDLYVVPRVIE
jgi:aspartyl-tRNA(Asn)/glutamyl-tRNA(Gln) amidotransferase subunit C